MDAQRLGESVSSLKGGISLAALNKADVGAMQASAMRQSLLGQSLRMSRTLQDLRKRT